MSVPRMITMDVRQWRRESYGFSGFAYNDRSDCYYDGERVEIHDVTAVHEGPNDFFVWTALHTYALAKIDKGG